MGRLIKSLMKYKIVKDKEYLSKPTTPVSTIEEGEEIARKLVEALSSIENKGLGLSANQIGINKSVAIVNVDGELVTLINPVVKEKSKEKLLYTEGCLSIPGKIVTTVRHKSVTIECLNWANPRTFEATVEDDDIVLKDMFKNIEHLQPKKKPVNIGLLQSICVQHEIDHLRGVLITDNSVKFNNQATKPIEHGRNEKVMIEKNGKTQFIKHKKADSFLKDGWKIV